MNFSFQWTKGSLSDLINSFTERQKRLEEKCQELVDKLADMGVDISQAIFDGAQYDGTNDVTVRAEYGEKVSAVVAIGGATLFIEFGAGNLFGWGHPAPMEYGPGTYNPASSNWKNPNGWYFGNGQHTYGNAPAMPMYTARKELEQNLARIAREVFA